MPVPNEQRATLDRFAAAVAASPHNLVSQRAREELLTRHVPEAVAVAQLLPSSGGRLLDIGSGGGFPGFVIAVVRPDFEVHLLDSTAKKTRFLREIADELAVSVSVHTGRAEELGRGALADQFDVVTARAVAPLDRLARLAAPFLAPGGVLYAVKGEQWGTELASAERAIARAGLVLAATPDDLEPAVDSDEAVAPKVVMLSRARR